MLKYFVSFVVVFFGMSFNALLGNQAVYEEVESASVKATLDPVFPRIVSYVLKDTGDTLDGQVDPVAVVELNGKAQACKVVFRKINTSTAEYRLNFTESQIALTFRISAGDHVIDIKLTKVKESGDVRFMKIAFPGNALITLRSSQTDAAIATVFAQGYNGLREQISELVKMKPAAETANYFFVSTGTLAAGIASNHIDDCQRIGYRITGEGAEKTCTASNTIWQYREIETETLPLPLVKVFLTGDRNGDNKANWQDAAVLYREIMPKPYGAEYVKTQVGDQVAMNFASLAQQPFLRILDEVKKGYLATDGLGQTVTIKGFSAEGHDSANTDCGGHYNQRAGGLKDLNYIIKQGSRYKTRFGVHINATEVYPEAHRYQEEILARDGNGNPIGGWYWLDSSRYIDKRKDLLTGNLFESLDLMESEIPDLDFIYVDVYGDHGWNAWKLATKLNEMGLAIHSEYATIFDPWSTWCHHRLGSQVFRFIWNSDRDFFSSDPLLRGAGHTGFMGWQNQNNFNSYIRTTFVSNLPSKFLQNFPLLRWEPGKIAVFGDGVKAVNSGGVVSVTQDDRLIMTWHGNGANSRLFIPWDPKTEKKIYAWDDTGKEGAWTLPPSWKKRKTVYMYKLNDRGRTEETSLTVKDGQVTLQLAKSTPYVIYPKKAPRQKTLKWGEGGFVKDPGFDSHDFGSWAKSSADSEDSRIVNSDRGNSILTMESAGSVSQKISGLKRGQTYAASVWVQIKGDRKAAIDITPVRSKTKTVYSNTVDKTDVRNMLNSNSKIGTFFQRLKVTFTLPGDCSSVIVALKVENTGEKGIVEFDDVRLVEAIIAKEAEGHAFYEDFENVDEGWGPFMYACNGQTQTHLSELHEGVTRDTINGQYSLKTINEPAGIVIRTTPSMLRLKPATRYKVTCNYIADNDFYRLVVQGNIRSSKSVRLNRQIEKGSGTITETFATGSGTGSFLAIFKNKGGGGMFVIDDIVIDELGPAKDPVDDADFINDNDRFSRQVLLEERFSTPLTTDWTIHKSKRSGTDIKIADEQLLINAAAHVAAAVERKLPAGTTAVECQLTSGKDMGQTWGAGLALVWPGEKFLRVNLRGPAGHFGIDRTGASQRITGGYPANSKISLRIKFADGSIIVETRSGVEANWVVLDKVPTKDFPGEPTHVRLGKMDGSGGFSDHYDPGQDSAASYLLLRVYGK